MKLLIDQNLSRRLPAEIADLFPGSVHVRDLQMARATDVEIWNYAKESDFIVTSKDGWFVQRSLIAGPPPKVIWIRAGNCSAQKVQDLLRRNAIRIQAFAENKQSAYIALS